MLKTNNINNSRVYTDTFNLHLELQGPLLPSLILSICSFYDSEIVGSYTHNIFTYLLSSNLYTVSQLLISFSVKTSLLLRVQYCCLEQYLVRHCFPQIL